MAKRLSELVAALPDVIAVSGDVEISAPVVEADVDLKPGGVFVARRGLSRDGHDFIPRAIELGAAAIVGERDMPSLSVPYVQVTNAQESIGLLAAAYHDFPSRKLTVIGVTGTDGKTTTSTLIHSILQAATDGRTGLISTVNAVLGDRVADTGLHVTTPGAPQVQEFLAQMVASGLTHCVLEMTSHGLAQGRLQGVEIDAAVMTNVTHEHLDYHGSFEHYRAAKARMFEMLGNPSPHPPPRPTGISFGHTRRGGENSAISLQSVGDYKLAVINADDANADYFAAIPAGRRLMYGLSERADIRARDVRYRPDGTSFEVIGALEMPMTTALVGAFNVLNVLAAVALAHGLGCTAAQIDAGIRAVKAISGRMERIDEGQNFTAIVDFAHTPNALENALKAGREMLGRGQRLISVFGSAGLRDREKRRMMAETSARLADMTILTAEDPRTESLDGILEVMAEACVSQGGVEGETFLRVADRGEALFRACQMAGAGDIVMACGKGHEQSMCFGVVEYPWDDREGLRAALRGAPLRTLPTANPAQ